MASDLTKAQKRAIFEAGDALLRLVEALELDTDYLSAWLHRIELDILEAATRKRKITHGD